MANSNMTPWNPWNWLNDQDVYSSSSRGMRSWERDSSSPRQPLSYFGPFSSMYREMIGQALDTFRSNGLHSLSGLNPMKWPSVDIETSDKQYTIIAETPGFNEKDIRIHLSSDGTLTIQGERRQDINDREDKPSRSESYSSFRRMLTLPEDVEEDDLQASYENGVLTIQVPRKEKSRMRQIPISGRRSGAEHRERESQESANRNSVSGQSRKAAA